MAIRLAIIGAVVAMTGAGAASGAPAPVVTITCSATTVTITPGQVKYGRYSVVYVNRTAMTAQFAFQGKRGSGALRPGERVVRSMTRDRHTRPIGNPIDHSATPVASYEHGCSAPQLGPGGHEWNTVAGQSRVVCAVTPCKPNTYAVQERADRALLAVPAG